MRRRRHKAFALIELMIVIAIAGGLIVLAGMGFNTLTKSRLRSTASRMASTIRHAFDRANATGLYYRMVIDLTQGQYWLERSENRMYLRAGKEKSPGKGRAFDADEEERRLDEQDRKDEEDRLAKQAKLQGSGGGGALFELEPPPKPKRARFQKFRDDVMALAGTEKERHVVAVKLGKVKAEVYTPRQPEPYTQGRAYLYFFPDGHGERALIHLQDGDDWYSLSMSPLTARVEVQPGKLELQRDFDTKDLLK